MQVQRECIALSPAKNTVLKVVLLRFAVFEGRQDLHWLSPFVRKDGGGTPVWEVTPPAEPELGKSECRTHSANDTVASTF